MTKTSDNNELTSINTYYVRDFGNNAVTNDTVVGVRLKTLGVHCYEDLPAVGKLLFSSSVTYRRRQDSDAEILNNHLPV